MDLGKISGKTLDLPEKTEVYVVDFINKKLLLKATIENSIYDPAVFQAISAAQEEQAKIHSQKKKSPKKVKKSA